MPNASDPIPGPSDDRPDRGRLYLALGAIGAVAVVAALVVFEPWTAFTNVTVDEALPVTAALPTPSSSTVTTVAPTLDPDGVEPTGQPAPPPTNPPTSPPTTTPPAGPVVLASGEFRGIEHETSGTATLVDLGDGSVIVRFEDLDTSNGPDLKVYLSPQPADGPDAGSVDGAMRLGDLKGNKGNQNYDVAPGTDLSGYRSVVIWCERFSVAFGVAALA